MVTQAENVEMDSTGLERVKSLFHEQLNQGTHPGSAMAVYHHGKLVLDLYGGLANVESNRPVTKDTLFVIFSCTKAISAFCWHLLRERGQIELGHWIADYWPEFAKNGKEHVTSRHILTHTAGFPDTPKELTGDKIANWLAAVNAMEDAKLTHQPGNTIAYHSLNFGWVLGEIVRRVDGRPINKFLRDEVTTPLGINDLFLGLPPNLEPRVAKAYPMENYEAPEKVEFFNTHQAHQAVIPAANGISTARDLARFFAMLSLGGKLDGAELIRPGVIREISALQEQGKDRNSGRHVKLGLGVAIDDPSMGTPRGSGRYRHSFGHSGLGSCIAWANLESQLAVAIVTNGVRDDASNTLRLSALSDAVWDACL